MSENKSRKNNRIIKSDREILNGIMEENRGYILTIEIPGRGKLRLKIKFEPFKLDSEPDDDDDISKYVDMAKKLKS